MGSDRSVCLIADDFAILPLKAVKGLCVAERKRFSVEFAAKPTSGRVAAVSLALLQAKDIARMTAGKGGLSIDDWLLLPRTRLDLFSLHGHLVKWPLQYFLALF